MGIVLIAIFGLGLAIYLYNTGAGFAGALAGIIVGALLATVYGKRNTNRAIGREVGKAVHSPGAAPAPVSAPRPGQPQTVEDRLASLDRRCVSRVWGERRRVREQSLQDPQRHLTPNASRKLACQQGDSDHGNEVQDRGPLPGTLGGDGQLFGRLGSRDHMTRRGYDVTSSVHASSHTPPSSATVR